MQKQKNSPRDLELPVTTRVLSNIRLIIAAVAENLFWKPVGMSDRTRMLFYKKLFKFWKPKPITNLIGWKCKNSGELWIYYDILWDKHHTLQVWTRKFTCFWWKKWREFTVSVILNWLNWRVSWKNFAMIYIPHSEKEDHFVPYIRNLDPNYPSPAKFFFTVFPVPCKIRCEWWWWKHDLAESYWKDAKHQKYFTLPEGACLSYSALFNRLEALEKDFYINIFIWKTISCFRKAINGRFIRKIDLKTRLSISVY